MKKFLVSTILLLSSFGKLAACGYSPYGEDTRYCLFHPEYFKYKQYKAFFYNANLFGFEDFRSDDNQNAFITANVADWHLYTNKKVSVQSIQMLLNDGSFSDINSNNENEFVKYLYQNKKTEAIQYLTFAKRCEAANNIEIEDPWERNPTAKNPKSDKLLGEVLQLSANSKSTYFKRKYSFLAIRLAYYLGKPETVRLVFDSKFKNSGKDYLYYWSAFFNAMVSSSPDKMNDVAALLEHSPEKYYAAYYFFYEKFNLAESLKHAKSNEDIANLYGYASVQKVDKNLEYLKKIYQNNPKSKLFGFLLLREINKIEDWVYTPYYTNYLPSTAQYGYYWGESEERETTLTLRARAESDRIYAKEVLDFIQSIPDRAVADPVLWNASEIQLLFITRNYDECLSKIKSFKSQYKNEAVFGQIEKIEALTLTAAQFPGKAVILKSVQPMIQKYQNDARFIFALGRELEFKENISDGIALMSIANQNRQSSYDGNDVEWKGNRVASSNYLSEFYTYFDYLDFVYDANQLKKVIVHAENANSDFDRFLYASIVKDLPYLKDLLGTKYIREDRLAEALKTFRGIGQKYWNDNYNAWERGKYGEYYAFDQNPFFKLRYTPRFVSPEENFIVTKLSVTEHLIKYINLANNAKTKDRDYYYFIIANCYYNMSDAGNSWMMRRYSSSGYYDQQYINESYADEREYRMSLKAQHYYKLAYLHAKTDKFRALCLRMNDFATTGNEFVKLKKEFPQYHDELSNCDNLQDYFRNRR